MKKVVLIVSLLFSTSFIYAQDVPRNPATTWRQHTARINVAITPQVEYVKIAGDMDLNISLSGVLTFNNKFFIGGYVTKKPLRTYKDYSGINYDASFQHLGLIVGNNMDLGLYRTDGGHYVRRKTKLVYSLKLGGGAVWLVDENKFDASLRDYFYVSQANIGATRPISKFINVEIGAFYVAVLSIDQLDNYFTSKDFSGPGAYLAFKFNLFR